MRVVSNTNRTISDFFILENPVRLKPQYNPNPSYQRESVWDKKKKQALIASIFNGYLVAPFQIYVENAQVNEEIVDGKQRLSAIEGFLKNYYPIAEEANSLPNNLGIIPEGTYFRDLNRNQRNFFLSYVLNTVTLTDATDAEIRYYFRVQNTGTPLTSQEWRNTISCPVREIVAETISKHPFLIRYNPEQKRLSRDMVALKLLIWEYSAQHKESLDLSKKRQDLFYTLSYFPNVSAIASPTASLMETMTYIHESLTTNGLFDDMVFRKISQTWLMTFVILCTKVATEDMDITCQAFADYIYFHRSKEADPIAEMGLMRELSHGISPERNKRRIKLMGKILNYFGNIRRQELAKANRKTATKKALKEMSL